MHSEKPTKPSGGGVRAVIELMRPGHWVKNIIVLFPVVFAKQVGQGRAWLLACLATAAFCLASSAAYILNDICDRDRDRRHPRKSGRPLASGRISAVAAGIEAVLLAAAAVGVALSVNLVGGRVNFMVFFAVLAYLVLQVAYSAVLKSKMLLDVICIALGFVLRAVAGAVAIPVEVSPWLFVCTFTICLFMGFCKRYSEMIAMPDRTEAREHRLTLAGYTPELLTHLVTLSGSVAVVGFLVYAMSPLTVGRFGTDYLVYTSPLVVYGIFRFAMLSMKGVYSDPAELVLRDRPFQLACVLWIIAAAVVIQWGVALQEWLARH